MVRHQGEEAAQPGRTGKWLNTAEGWARANVLYEKADRPPKAGSLKEALFLSVWLKRQEARIVEARILAQGLSDLIGEKNNVAEVFQNLIVAILPYSKQEQVKTDEKMKEAMKREVARGVITFKTEGDSPLQKRAKVIREPDEMTKKMIERARRLKR